MYRRMQRGSQQQGPIFMYSCSMWMLLVAYLCQHPFAVSWSTCERSWGTTRDRIAMGLSTVGQFISGPTKRSKFRTAIDAVIRQAGLMPLRIQYVRVPYQCQVLPCRKLYESILMCSGEQQYRIQWNRQHCKFIHGHTPTHQDFANGPRVARLACMQEVASRQALAGDLSFCGSTLIKRRWDVRVRKPCWELVKDIVDLTTNVVLRHVTSSQWVAAHVQAQHDPTAWVDVRHVYAQHQQWQASQQ
eukprot:11178979-Lingulodinium_polyedra.AAC.2